MIKENKTKSKKRIKNFLVFYSFICIAFFVSYTFSRYVDTTSGNSVIEIAKFNVLVNEQNVTSDNPFYLKLSDTTNTFNDKMAPNSSGYFEITIDPTGTEVSIDYSFLFNFSNVDSDVRNNINLTSYELAGVVYPITDNFIQGSMLLPNINNAFTANDAITLKINWVWNQEDIINPDIDETDVNVIAVIKQKID